MKSNEMVNYAKLDPKMFKHVVDIKKLVDQQGKKSKFIKYQL